VRHLSVDTAEPRLTFMGSGDFHHVTVFLIGLALEHQPAPVTIIHFDNHPDWVKFDEGMHCGSWINRALEHPKVAKIITVGVCSHDLRRPEWKGADLSPLSAGRQEIYPYDHAPSRVRRNYGSGACFEQKRRALHWKTIRSLGKETFVDYMLSRIATPSVYLTVDKDVLAREDAITNWDQGRMRMPYLLSLVRAIAKRHVVIGADVTGDYSTPRFSGDLWTRFTKRVECFIDQPDGKPDPAQTLNINSAANHALLEVFSEVIA
jgi:Arginase family